MRILIAAATLVLAVTGASAQVFPARPVEVVNAFAPGGANDLNVRAMQVVAERVLGQPLVQTFRQGGGGIVGSADVANAPADGYKILVVTSGELTAAPNLAKTTYTLDSFAFLGRISAKPYALVVKNDSPWKNFGEMLAAAKAPGGKVTVGTTPAGGMFLTAQHFIKRGGVPLTTVPYGGAGPALTAVLGGHIDSVWAPLAAAEAQIRAGGLRAVGMSGAARVKGHDVPTFRELGIEAPYVQWIGFVAPRATPNERLAILREALFRIAREPDFLKTADKLGIDVSYASADEFEKQVRDEDRAFKALVTELGLTPK